MGFLKKALKWGAEHPIDNKITRKMNEKTNSIIEKENEKFEVRVKEAAEKYDIRKGIEVTVITPEIELITKNTSSDLMRTMATFSWGVAGYAMTSGKKTVEQNKKIETILKVVPNGIVFDKASADGKDIRIPWDNIVKTSRSKQLYFNLHLIENQEFEILVNPFKKGNKEANALTEHISRVINENASGVEEEGWS